MRLTVNLDSELYAVARSLAREAGVSTSAAVNLLLRRALTSPRPPARGRGKAAPVGRAGLPLARCRRSFTSDDVYRLDSETA